MIKIGGNAVAVLTQRLLSEKKKLPKIQVLIYPWTQLVIYFAFFFASNLLLHEVFYLLKDKFSFTISCKIWKLWLIRFIERFL